MNDFGQDPFVYTSSSLGFDDDPTDLYFVSADRAHIKSKVAKARHNSLMLFHKSLNLKDSDFTQ